MDTTCEMLANMPHMTNNQCLRYGIHTKWPLRQCHSLNASLRGILRLPEQLFRESVLPLDEDGHGCTRRASGESI
jgi:hypothetical protein